MFKRQSLIAFIAFSCAATPIYAQGIGRQLARTGLTQEDVGVMVERGSSLYRNGGAQVGDDTVWQNPETGAHGLAEITDVEGNCIRIAYRFITTKQKSLQSVVLRRCLTNGEWVLSD